MPGGDRPSGRQRRRVGSRALGLHPDDLRVGPQRANRDGRTREQSAAAGAHDDGPHVGALLNDLQAKGALPGDDVGVVEGVDQCGTGLLGIRRRLDERLVDGVAGDVDVGAVRPGGLELRQRRARGHATVAVVPAKLAASATPCAWLPALAATTPWRRCSSVSREMRGYAPRILNEPARCRFSHLR